VESVLDGREDLEDVLGLSAALEDLIDIECAALVVIEELEDLVRLADNLAFELLRKLDTVEVALLDLAEVHADLDDRDHHFTELLLVETAAVVLVVELEGETDLLLIAAVVGHTTDKKELVQRHRAAVVRVKHLEDLLEVVGDNRGHDAKDLGPVLVGDLSLTIAKEGLELLQVTLIVRSSGAGEGDKEAVPGGNRSNGVSHGGKAVLSSERKSL